ncbi:hypothetical protein ACFX2H_013112 [Malus domestica]
MPDTMIEECMGLNANHFIFGMLSCFELHVHHDWIDISAYGSTVVKYANLFFSKLTTLSMVFFSAMVLASVRTLPLVASITNLHCIPSMSSMITNKEMFQRFVESHLEVLGVAKFALEPRGSSICDELLKFNFSDNPYI